MAQTNELDLFAESPELLAEKRKQQLAMALLEQLSKGAPQPEKTRILAKTPLAGVLMNTVGQHFARGDLRDADQRVAEISRGDKEKRLAGYSSATNELMTSPDKNAAIAKFLASGDPMVRALAQAELKAMREREAKAQEQGNSRANALMPVLGQHGMVPQAGEIARTGQIPQGLQAPAAVPPQVQWVDDPNNPGKKIAHQIDTKRTGEMSGTLASPGQSISMTTNLPGSPGREKEMLTEANLEVFKKDRLPQAKAAQTALGNNARIIEELEKGAQTGAFQDTKQLIAKAGTIFGVDAEKLGSIDNVKKALFENVFQKAQALRPVSNEELKILMEQVGSIDTDPQALSHILAWYNAQALKSLQELDASLAPHAKGENAALWEGLRGGIKTPDALSGPTWFQLRTLQDLQRIGGDISRYQDSIGPIPPDAQFNVRGGAKGLQAPPSANRPKASTGGWRVLKD